MVHENTSLSDGADDAGIARYTRASFAIVGNCVLCILHHSLSIYRACGSNHTTLKLRRPTPLMYGP